MEKDKDFYLLPWHNTTPYALPKEMSDVDPKDSIQEY